MNIPNRLTVFRMIMVPVFVAILFIEAIPMRFLWATLVFAGLSFTDMLDGKIARSRGLITNFGKFLDPLADKMLVVSALVAMTLLKASSTISLILWLVSIIIVIAREFMISALRLVCVEQGNVIAANMWGKVKTVTQFIAILVILFTEQLLEWFTVLPAELRLVGDVLYGVSIIATIVSGIVYIKQNAASIGQM